MSKEVTAVRFEPEEKERIEAFTGIYDTTFSGLVRRWTLERLEDELDALDLKKAIEEDDGTWYSMDEVEAMLAEE